MKVYHMQVLDSFSKSESVLSESESVLAKSKPVCHVPQCDGHACHQLPISVESRPRSGQLDATEHACR